MKKWSALDTKIVLYQSKTGALELKADGQHETIWLTQLQVADLFEVQKSAISKHVKNIFDSCELVKKSTVSNLETVQKEGNRSIKREIEHYNLDLVLSIGYRINSKKATHFRQWATKILKGHIIDGYTMNRHRMKSHYTQFLKAVDDLKNLLPNGGALDHNDILALVRLFSDTWLSLNAYDQDTLQAHGATK